MNLKKLKRLVKQTEAVSPVVATLMLVLVAAGAAVGLNLFMNSFQEDATQDVSIPDGAKTLTIAGSSTVYEFSLAALQGDPSNGLPSFEEFAAQSGTPIKVELEKGGSGAGRKAVGLCLVDIGSSSSPVKGDDFDAYPDCDRDGQKDFGTELKVFKVATDAVVFATLPSNTHCPSPIALTEAQAYELYTTNADDVGGSYTGTAAPVVLDSDASGAIEWDEVPLLAGGFCTGTEVVEIFDRSDPGGTSEIASEKLFGQKQDQLEDFGVTLPASNQGDGNQGVLDAVTDHADAAHALFFTSFGYANNEGVDIHAFGTTTAIVPTSSNIGSETYDATRPILYITAGEPSPVEQVWLDFVMNAHRNQLIAENAAFESIY